MSSNPKAQEKKNKMNFAFYTIMFLITLNMLAYGIKNDVPTVYWFGPLLCMMPFFMMFKTGYDQGWELRKQYEEDNK